MDEEGMVFTFLMDKLDFNGRRKFVWTESVLDGENFQMRRMMEFTEGQSTTETNSMDF